MTVMRLKIKLKLLKVIVLKYWIGLQQFNTDKSQALATADKTLKLKKRCKITSCHNRL